jgi:hypothetical protein
MDLNKNFYSTSKVMPLACRQVRVRTNVRAGGGYVAGVYYPDKSGACAEGIPVQLPDRYPVEETPTQLPSYTWIGGKKVVDMSWHCK